MCARTRGLIRLAPASTVVVPDDSLTVAELLERSTGIGQYLVTDEAF